MEYGVKMKDKEVNMEKYELICIRDIFILLKKLI